MTSSSTADNSNRSCPKCGQLKSNNELECSKCGIVFEKYEKIQNKKLQESEAAKEQEKLKSEKIEKKDQQKEEKKIHAEQLKQKLMNKIKHVFTPSLRKILITFLVFAVFIGIAYFFINGKNDRDYLANLRLANSIMTLSTIKCVEMSEQYSTVWRKAIEDKYDSDFNDDISDQRRKFVLNGDIQEIDDSKKLVEELLQKLNQPKELYPEAHKKIVELYGVYSQIHSLAQSPSGSLVSYNNQVNDLQSGYIRIINELKVLLPKEK